MAKEKKTVRDRIKKRLAQSKERRRVMREERLQISRAKRRTTLSGSLAVCGSGTLDIPVRGIPKKVEAYFAGEVPMRMSCGPTVDDRLEIGMQRKFPFNLWEIHISWEIASGGVRELEWSVEVRS